MRFRSFFVCVLLVGLAGGFTLAETRFDSSTFGGLQARPIGPAVMSGRIAALDAIHRDGKLRIWAGAAGGGVWVSENGGTSFEPVFDEYTMAIGAVKIDRSDPDRVWIGTGEPWTRNSISIGTGMYKTLDGGDEWVHVGLADTEHISRILIHPAEPDTVWVCATGHLWDGNEQRGVFKTTDGGENWDKILYVDQDTGCSDLVIDPQEPDILYSAMWQFRRWPWTFKSGGPGSAIYKSVDGGATWKKIEKGLPEGELGRIALAVAPTRPNVLYATVESEKTAMFRSDDLGESWYETATAAAVESRPFYFSLLVPDPSDHNRIYKPAGSLAVSDDGGKTFTGLGGGTHADHHALWVDSENPLHLLLGTDGGVYESNNRGVHWNFLNRIPVSQFYQVSVDMERPYNVYGGLQDNGTWMGPSSGVAGIKNKHWDNIGMGDGFHAYVEKAEPDLVYVEWQGGRVERMRKSTGEVKSIQPLERKDDPKYRYSWNTALHVSPTRDNTLYVGAQFLFLSRDRGDSWKRISPDLTTDNPDKQKQMESGGLTVDNSTAENHCTIYSIAESSLDENIVWVGTDDGNVQVTRDGGESWNNVTANFEGVPPHTWVTQVEAGHHDPGVAYVTFDGHRTGDMTTYIYGTSDYGKSWQALATDDVAGYSLVVREDLVNEDLLFLGTEFGLYVSIDRGNRWARFKGGLPKVGVRDMVIHPREHDLVMATHGRGIFILDDLTPLRELKETMLGEKIVLLGSRPAVQTVPNSIQEFPGDDEWVGDNPDGSAWITYYMAKRHMFGDLKIEVYDDQGELITTIPAGKRRGINRANWSMRHKMPKVAPAKSLVMQVFSFMGPYVPVGEYSFKLIKGKTTLDGTIEAQFDPRADYTPEELAVQDREVMELYRMVEQFTFMVDSLIDIRDQGRARKDGLGEKDKLGVALQAFDDDLESLRKDVLATRKGGMLAGEEKLRERLTWLYGAINGYEGQPGASQMEYKKVLAEQEKAAERRFEALLATHLVDLNKRLEKKKLEPLARLTLEAWEER
jgi:photosystem II stability/assembly factor-like uncharacterized protein